MAAGLMAKYNRVLLKLSGEAFKGSQGYGIDVDAIGYMANQIKLVVDMGVQLGVVVGRKSYESLQD